ncbi:12165_t:CDS:2, partial [Dentiscutata erythropus]
IKPVFQMMQIVAEMAWQKPTSHEQSESGTVNLSDIVNVSMLADNKNDNEDEELEENEELDENEELEEISIDTLNTANRLDCYLADYKNLKIKLQYLFLHILTQPSFVRIIEQDIENVEAIQ